MDFIELLKVIFLGIVEGITEWLPISSTGHLLLVDEFLKVNLSKDFMSMFNVVIQLGAILAVVVLFFKKLWPFSKEEKNYIKKDTFTLWFKIVVACIPGIVMIPFDSKIEELFFNPQTIATTLILYGILFIVIENRNAGKQPKVAKLSDITYQMAFMIGLFQILAMIPGTSRSGATIIGAMLLGASRYVAAEFTFFLAIPTMFGASFLKLLKFGFTFTGAEIVALITGMLTAFIVSIISIKFLMGYIKKNNFKVFGWYRIVLGIIVAGYFLLAR
ncbi:MAG TPA: undecaprenyl-diphosphatase [Lachnoclostridium phytofermentans]|uniref:Undecaprenyl-diphosphatase n=1 Tax=Lachnoclostridium phytofermentans TaxID=66219 RepID=A0A3D2X8S2_9FIRM|nr:undecaprenyl-diphosphate phosphatase [Lachnoclostridium sp.]HCL03386.1 undecaprenyl-diphosphatase [Lachnoclostridium phytofermentans]